MAGACEKKPSALSGPGMRLPPGQALSGVSNEEPRGRPEVIRGVHEPPGGRTGRQRYQDYPKPLQSCKAGGRRLHGGLDWWITRVGAGEGVHLPRVCILRSHPIAPNSAFF